MIIFRDAIARRAMCYSPDWDVRGAIEDLTLYYQVWRNRGAQPSIPALVSEQ